MDPREAIELGGEILSLVIEAIRDGRADETLEDILPETYLDRFRLEELEAAAYRDYLPDNGEAD